MVIHHLPLHLLCQGVSKEPVNLGSVKKSLLNEISCPIKPSASKVVVQSTTDKPKEEPTKKTHLLVGQIASTSGSQSPEVNCSGNSHVVEMAQNPHVIVHKTGVNCSGNSHVAEMVQNPQVIVCETGVANNVVPANSGLKSPAKMTCISQSTFDDEIR